MLSQDVFFCLSVCLSVRHTPVFYRKKFETAKRIIKLFPPSAISSFFHTK